MNSILRPKIFIPIVIITFLVGLHFYINYRVRSIIKYEIKKMTEKKQKKQKENNIKMQMRQQRQQRQQEHEPQMDLDSYDDPADLYDGRVVQQVDQQVDQQVGQRQSGKRLTKNDILMRDLAEM